MIYMNMLYDLSLWLGKNSYFQGREGASIMKAGSRRAAYGGLSRGVRRWGVRSYAEGHPNFARGGAGQAVSVCTLCASGGAGALYAGRRRGTAQSIFAGEEGLGQRTV